MEQTKDLNRLFHLLDQEISSYQQLVRNLKQESECLRKGSTDALIQTVRGMDSTREGILEVQSRIREAVLQILPNSGEESEDPLSRLLSRLPPPDHRKIRAYQKNLLQLKEWAKQINDLNRSYVQESLHYLREFVSLLTQPVSEVKGYLQNGRQSSLMSHSWALNKEV